MLRTMLVFVSLAATCASAATYKDSMTYGACVKQCQSKYKADEKQCQLKPTSNQKTFCEKLAESLGNGCVKRCEQYR